MVDQTMDALLEAVRELTVIVLHSVDPPSSVELKLIDILKKLDALIAQRKGKG